VSLKYGKILSIVLVLCLVAAACGGGSDDGEGSAPSDDADSGGSESVVADDVDANEATGADDRAATGDPVYGGRLVYGVEADSANPWVHYATSCAISCRMIFRAITDALFITAEDGSLVPYLVDSVEPSADFTQWTMTIKDGIFFHDGTPLDGAAVKYNIDACRRSPLTGAAFIGLNDVTAEGQTVTMTYGQPDAVGPKVLRAETCGFMFSPTWMATLANNPLLTADEAAAATGDPAAPVGLGAFVFDSYTPGNGNSFVATRNADYWRGNGPNSLTDEGLPYLDAVEFAVAVDVQGRSNALRSGQFDVMHTSNADEIVAYDGDDFVVLQANDFGETSYVLLNVAQGDNAALAALGGTDSFPMDPEGVNADNPLIHLSCRKALAHSIDRDLVVAERWAGIAGVANGPFPPGTLGYLEDSGYPQYDPAAAAAEWEQCKTDHGEVPVRVAFNTTNDPFNVETNEFVSTLVKAQFGDEIDITIAPIEQGQYINLALAGQFQAQAWRNHGGVDPSEQWYWWSSVSANPIGGLALNFGRFTDPEIDAQLQVIRTNPDTEARRAAAEAVNRSFAENVWNLWYAWTVWGIIADPQVQNLTALEIPGAGPAMPVVAGKHHLAQIWCTDGDCEG
jgi:peptide/nickel transport system substrate-binding protein